MKGAEEATKLPRGKLKSVLQSVDGMSGCVIEELTINNANGSETPMQ